MLFNEALSKLLTPEEQEKFHHIRKRIKDIDRVKIAIMQSLVENTEEPYNKPLGVYFDSPRLVRLREYRSKLDCQLDELQNIALCRLSGNSDYKHDFVTDISDITLSDCPEDREIVLNAINSFRDMLNTIPDPPENYQDNNRLQIKRGTMTVEKPKEPITSKNRPDLSYSEKIAHMLSEHYSKVYPEQKELYTWQPGESLTDYVDRISQTLENLAVNTDNIEIPSQLIPDEITSVKAKKIDKAIITKDKISRMFAFNMISAMPDKQIGVFEFETGKVKEQQAIVTLSLDFNDLTNKKISAFDTRVQNGICSAFYSGNSIMSITQIYKAMGFKGKPGKQYTEKIRESINRQSTILININNVGEIELGMNYPKFNYKGPLLPAESITAVINGKETDTAVRLLDAPPLMRFAQGRKSLRVIDLRVLQSDVSKTANNLAIEHYLLQEILYMKDNPNRNPRIKFETIFSTLKLTSKKTRYKDTIIDLLEHYKRVSFIDDYKEDDTGVIITLTDSKKAISG